jgi:outer membrane lipoprotein-sorting protein
MQIKRPDKVRMEMTMNAGNLVLVYNGKDGWMSAPWRGAQPEKLGGKQLDQAIDFLNIEGELFNYKEKGLEAKLMGKEFLGDTEMYHIKLIDKNKKSKSYYLDTKEYLIRKVTSVVVYRGENYEQEQIFSEYEDLDGITVAMKTETVSDLGRTTVVYEKFLFNEKLKDTLFEL